MVECVFDYAIGGGPGAAIRAMPGPGVPAPGGPGPGGLGSGGPRLGGPRLGGPRLGGGALDGPGLSGPGLKRGVLDGQGQLPVLPALRELLAAGGLPRGQVVAVPGGGLLSAALAAGASAGGAWCAAVGLPALGVTAAAEVGLDPGRLLLVPAPGPSWPSVVAALLDGCDLVLVCPPDPPPAALRRKLEATARRHGSVILAGGEWAGAHARLELTQAEWTGLGPGHGRLRARRALVTCAGRGAGARPRSAWLWLPGPDGAVGPAAPLDFEISTPLAAVSAGCEAGERGGPEDGSAESWPVAGTSLESVSAGHRSGQRGGRAAGSAEDAAAGHGVLERSLRRPAGRTAVRELRAVAREIAVPAEAVMSPEAVVPLEIAVSLEIAVALGSAGRAAG
jgi:hypothetical protein